ncbi:asparaginase [Capnocytophaga sp. ARDL2]|uniref:asparaginase n=1 Tax=Capnocytophaga sp. ARDL2 TaxID=3238809 RepID=UPI003555CE10
MKPNILLIYTGGTIGMVKDFETGALKPFNFDQLLERIPELHLLDCKINTYSFENPIDSSDMNPTHWKSITQVIQENYETYDGFVVLHGSDTMAYSSSALSFMLKNLSKPVIFTGSQLPIGDLRTDAKENLITAIQIAALQDKQNQPVIQEVGLYFEYKLYRGNRCTKISAEHFNAFTSPNLPHLAESGVHLKIENHLLLPKNKLPLEIVEELDTRVFVLKIFPGINPEILKNILEMPNLRGIVLETFGSGNAPTEPWFLDTLENAIKRGVKVVNVTQCWGGSVDMGKYETGTTLQKIGVVSGHDITTEAAITKLMVLLPQNLSNIEFQQAFETAVCGELTIE